MVSKILLKESISISTDCNGKLQMELSDFARKEVTQIHDETEIFIKDADALLHFLPNDTDWCQDIFPQSIQKHLSTVV